MDDGWPLDLDRSHDERAGCVGWLLAALVVELAVLAGVLAAWLRATR